MDHQTIGGRKLRPGWLVAAGVAVVALVALGVPLASLLYVGVLLLCPLLMMGMHGGGHGHGSDGLPEARGHAHGATGSPVQTERLEPGTPQEGGRS